LVVLQVHRLLLAAVSDPSEEKESLLSNKMLQQLCDHMNKKHRVKTWRTTTQLTLFQHLGRLAQYRDISQRILLFLGVFFPQKVLLYATDIFIMVVKDKSKADVF